MKIGFLLNHYNIHQVPHIVPYAFELSRRYTDAQVAILGSTEEELNFANAIGKEYSGHNVKFEKLHVPKLINFLDPFLSKFIFSRKSATLKSNAKRLSEFDALVTPEMTSLSLKNDPRLKHTKLIFTGHGAGDNAFAGVGSGNNRIGLFDLALMPGEKYANGLCERGYLKPEQCTLVGYPKFEAIEKLNIKKQKLFDNDRKTVVYNPHQAKNFTSWHAMGEAVLDYFYQSDKYNLIFSPHVLLFKRGMTKGARLPSHMRDSENVRIDLSSQASCDMTYLKSADIYLGDCSSQIYEFLETPRPCVFLDGNKTDWHNNEAYLSWTFGPVIDHSEDLDRALNEAVDKFEVFLPKQKEAFSYTIHNPQDGITASVRGAIEIASFMKMGNGHSP